MKPDSVNSSRIEEWFSYHKNHYRFASGGELYFLLGYAVASLNSKLLDKKHVHMANCIYDKAIRELRKRYEEERLRKHNRDFLTGDDI